MVLNFNDLEYKVSKKVEELYKKRIDMNNLKQEIEELKAYIIENLEYINNDEFNVKLKEVKGKVDYKSIVNYFLDIEKIDLEEFRNDSIVHLIIKSKTNDIK